MYGPDFIRRYAPSLSFVDTGNDQGGAGLDINDAVSGEVDPNTGMPLPFMRSGGQRTYYNDGGELRGRAAPMVGMHDSPIAPGVGAPQNGPVSLRPPAPINPPSISDQRRQNISGVAGIPPAEENYYIPPGSGLSSVTLNPQQDPPSEADQRRQGVSRTLTIPPGNSNSGLDSYVPPGIQYSSGTIAPPQDLLRGRTREGTRNGQPARPTTPERSSRPLSGALPFGGSDQRMTTLGSLLDQFNFVFPRDDGNAGPTLRGRTTSMPDPNRALGTVGDISSYPDFGSESGLADFNSRFAAAARELGIESVRPVGPQGRSATRQQQFIEEYRQGRRSTRPSANSYHVNQVGGAYRAADITPQMIGGLRGPANAGRVQDILIRAGYPADIEVIWENNPPHYHIEPPQRFNPGTPRQR